MIALFRKLSELGILGINQRNADFLMKYNSRHLFPRVDDKVITKSLAQQAGVAVPETYSVIKYTAQVRPLLKELTARNDFVIKPSRGSGGEGILVINGNSDGLFHRSNGELLSEDEVAHHIFNILGGMYSLGGLPDKALIEYRVLFDPIFEALSYQGVPDIRIIVFGGVPVMGMARLPTRRSAGRANLHQGAVGAGINLGSGNTLGGVWNNRTIDKHPDTGAALAGITIPRWTDLLNIASRCYEMTEIVLQGVDIVLDRDKGPLLLEINARPGLAIQIANNCGLLPRLRSAERFLEAERTSEEKIAFARESFAV